VDLSQFDAADIVDTWAHLAGGVGPHDFAPLSPYSDSVCHWCDEPITAHPDWDLRLAVILEELREMVRPPV
jgi:hypothetical protein